MAQCNFFPIWKLMAFGFLPAKKELSSRFFCQCVDFCHGVIFSQSVIEEFNQRAQHLRAFIIRSFTIRAFTTGPFTIGGRYELNAHADSGQTGYCPANQRCLLVTGFEMDQNGYTWRQWSNHSDIAATQADISKLAAINIRFARRLHVYG